MQQRGSKVDTGRFLPGELFVDKIYGLDSYLPKSYNILIVLYMGVDILGFSLCLGCQKHNWAIGKA